MKKLLVIFAMMIAGNTFATVDVQGQATIVVENYHTDGEYFLQTVPTDYCIGIDSYALATAITQPVVIKSGYGCGNTGTMVGNTQINAATCAKISAEEVLNADGSYNPRTVKIKKDLSGCGAKAFKSNFVNAVESAIYNSYNASGYQVVEIEDVK